MGGMVAVVRGNDHQVVDQFLSNWFCDLIADFSFALISKYTLRQKNQKKQKKFFDVNEEKFIDVNFESGFLFLFAQQILIAKFKNCTVHFSSEKCSQLASLSIGFEV